MITAIVPSAGARTSIVLSTFLDTLDSPETRRTYDRVIRAALAAMRIDSFDQLDGATLATWRRSVVESHLAPNSQKVAVAALRAFLRFARMVGACHLPIEAITVALRTPKGGKVHAYTTVTDDEIGRLFAKATNSRDGAILAVLFGAGVRVSELTGLDVDDVLEGIEGGAALRVRHGKGNKPRTVPINDDVSMAIRRYLRATGRMLGDAGPLFQAHDSGAIKRGRNRLSTRSVNRLLACCAERGGIEAKNVSAHVCRHSYAMRCLRRGASTAVVAQLLGHASPVVTAEYLRHLALGELRAAVPELPTDG